jgi:TonB family protein
MKSKEGQPAEPDNQEQYEAAVLEFLEKEMANVQPAQKPDQQSDELDALVSDLLKQVMTEADQSQDAVKPLFDEEDELFAALTRTEEKTPNPAATPTPDAERLAATPAPMVFTSSSARKGNFPVLAAIFVGLVLVAGGAAYVLLRHPKEAIQNPVSSPAPTQTAGTESPGVPVPEQPAAQFAAAPVSPQLPSKATAAPSANPSPAPSEKTTAVGARAVQTSSAAQSAKASPAAQKVEPVATPVLNNEGPAVVQPPSAANSALSPAAVEKPFVPENAAPVNPPVAERRQVPLIPAPVSESLKPAQQPVPETPSAARMPVPAFPVSQVSPTYPELATKTRASGSVVLDLQIDNQGKVVKATPVSGPAIFYNAAVQAAMRWRYKPASLDGNNIKSQSRVTMVFNWKR